MVAGHRHSEIVSHEPPPSDSLVLDDFDAHKHAFPSFGLELLILPADAFVAVVNAEAGGDGIAEMFAGAIKVIIVESSSA